MKNKNTKKQAKEVSERLELLMRILVLIITGIILVVWRYLIVLLMLIHGLIVLFVGKRNRSIAEYSEYWNSELYRFMQYMTFVTNERPFPFTRLKPKGEFVK